LPLLVDELCEHEGGRNEARRDRETKVKRREKKEKKKFTGGALREAGV
jgi:hypothetical protein